MLLTAKHAIRKIGHKLRAGNARITTRVSGGDRWPDEPHYYAIDDLTTQETHHVRCEDRPSWTRYLAESQS